MRKARTPFVRSGTPAFPVATLTLDARDRLDERDGPDGEAWWIPNCAHRTMHRSSIFSLEGGLEGLPLRATFSPYHPLADIFHPPYPPIASKSISRDVPFALARAFRFSPLCIQGGGQTILHCAHRTSTVLSCAFCEHKGWSGCSPSVLRRPRVARAQETI
jgi:hypothetical protein